MAGRDKEFEAALQAMEASFRCVCGQIRKREAVD